MAVGLTVLAIGPSPALAIGATAILGFGFSFPWSSIASTVLRKIPSGERGSAVGALSAFVDVFVGISSFTAGAVAHRFGYSAAFGLAAIAHRRGRGRTFRLCDPSVGGSCGRSPSGR
jgi:hypothetical protein